MDRPITPVPIQPMRVLAAEMSSVAAGMVAIERRSEVESRRVELNKGCIQCCYSCTPTNHTQVYIYIYNLSVWVAYMITFGVVISHLLITKNIFFLNVIL